MNGENVFRLRSNLHGALADFSFVRGPRHDTTQRDVKCRESTTDFPVGREIVDIFAFKQSVKASS